MQLKFLDVKSWVCILLVCFISLAILPKADGQYSILWPRSVESLFDAGSDTLEWKKIFTGTLDNHHPFLMELGFDGHLLKGWYTFGGEKEIYTLDGFLENDQFFLEEWYSDSLETGSISGRIDGAGFTGYWENYRKNTRWNVQAEVITEAPKRPVLYHYWLGAESTGGTLDGHWSFFLEENKLIKGYFISPEGLIFDLTTYRAEEEQTLFLKMHHLDSMPDLTIQLDLSANSGIVYQSKSMDSLHISFTRKKEIELSNSHSFHHFEWGYVLSDFHKRILTTFQEKRDTIFRLVEINVPPKSEHEYRGQINYNGFLSPVYADQEVLSGIYQIKSYSAQQYRKQAAFPVLIDLKSKKWIDITEGVYSKGAWDLDLESFLTEHIMTKSKAKADSGAWKNLRATDFSMLVFAGDYLFAASLHDSLRGHMFIRIPADMIDRHFSSGSWLRKKMNSRSKK